MSGTADIVLNQLYAHASCRKYRPVDVDPDDIERIVAAAQRAATSSNLHLWSAVVVRESARREELSRLCGDQAHIRSAPVFIAWCADRNHLDRVAELRGYTQETRFVESFLVGAVDAALAMQNAAIAAEAMGYGICYIGGLRNNTAAVVELLSLPEHVFPIAGMTVGVPAKPPRPRPRPPLARALHWERYRPVPDTVLVDYDQRMRETGVYRGRHLPGRKHDGTPAPDLPEEEYGWMEHSARRGSVPRRTDLRSVLQRQGFPLE